MASQPGILDPIAAAGRYVTLDATPDLRARDLVARLARLAVDASLVIGLGEPLVRALDVSLPGLRTFPALSGVGCVVPSTQAAVFVHARGADHGDTLHAMQRALAALGSGLRVVEDIVGFRHLEGRDLSGYEDGTENPTGDDALAAALTPDGASFVAAQRWIHDLAGFDKLSPRERDLVIGRNRDSNDELVDAPPSAHVKRAAQEDYEPPAFMVRRSMPYGSVSEHGLYFVAYAASLAPFERVLTRMIGRDDGIVDGLFRFSRPVSGGYYWCPPVTAGHLDLRALAGGA